jgi:hypothetical protein
VAIVIRGLAEDAIRAHADSMLTMLRNIGAYGAGYDHAWVRQYQAAYNAALPAYAGLASPVFAGLVGAVPITVDGFWGIQTAKTVYSTLRVAYPSVPQPSDRAGSVQSWWSSYSVYITPGLVRLAAPAAELPPAAPPPVAPPPVTSTYTYDAASQVGAGRTGSRAAQDIAPTRTLVPARTTTTAVVVDDAPPDAPPGAPASDNTKMYVGLGLAALGVAIAVALKKGR